MRIIRVGLSTMMLCLFFLASAFGQQSKSGTQKRATKGTLIVSMKLVARGEEGYVVYFLVRTPSGSRVEEKQLPADASAPLSLQPGHYELLSYLRECNGNCGSL